MRATEISKLTFILILSLLVPIAVPLRSAHAETGYVSDMLIVALREGQGGEHNVIKYLRTDTPLEVLEEGNGYLRVRTEEGEEGWVPKQYISFETPKPVVIAGLKKEIAHLAARVKVFEEERASLRHELEAAKQGHATRVEEFEKSAEESGKEASRKNDELRRITEKYNTLVDRSKNVVVLMVENDRLKKANDRLNTEAERLREENTRLALAGSFRWFLAGSGVFLVGLIIGRLSRKKKYY